MKFRPRRILRFGGAFLFFMAGAFCLNGLVLAHRTTPVLHHTGDPSGTPGDAPLRVVTWNIAKAFVHRGDIRFVPADTARSRLVAIGTRLREIDADIVLLQEVLLECGPCPVNQMDTIADAAGYPFRVYGEHTNIGLPGFRISTGNAILSRFPITGPEVIDLPGRKPFWVTANSRRGLFATLTPPGAAPIRVANLHLDSRKTANRLLQAEACRALVTDTPWILGGDFNASPGGPVWQALSEGGRVCAAGQPTYPQWSPEVEIDGFTVSDQWQVVSTRRLQARGSDHLPVLTELHPPAIP